MLVTSKTNRNVARSSFIARQGQQSDRHAIHVEGCPPWLFWAHSPTCLLALLFGLGTWRGDRWHAGTGLASTLAAEPPHAPGASSGLHWLVNHWSPRPRMRTRHGDASRHAAGFSAPGRGRRQSPAGRSKRSGGRRSRTPGRRSARRLVRQLKSAQSHSPSLRVAELARN
jgi:hypothetical protein